MTWVNIANKESALSVRNKINALGAYVDATNSTNIGLNSATATLYGLTGANENIDNAFQRILKMLPDLMYDPFFSGKYITTKTCTNGETLPSFTYCKNFNIPAGVTVYTTANELCVILAETVTINGTIDASGKGGPGGDPSGPAGAGGAGGGNVHIACDTLNGTGTIKTNGNNGAASTGSATGYGDGGAGTAGGLPFGGIAPGATTFSDGGVCSMTWANLHKLGLFTMLHPRSTGGGGGKGGSNKNSSGSTPKGAGGGSGAGGSGGYGSAVATSTYPALGGGGGGGGGFIIIQCKSAIPALNLQANGGNGGAGNLFEAGGGGGGAIILLGKTSISASTSVIGGAASGVGTGSGAAGIVISYLIP